MPHPHALAPATDWHALYINTYTNRLFTRRVIAFLSSVDDVHEPLVVALVSVDGTIFPADHLSFDRRGNEEQYLDLIHVNDTARVRTYEEQYGTTLTSIYP